MRKTDFAQTLGDRDELLLSAPLGVSLEIISKCNLNVGAATEMQEINKEKQDLDLNPYLPALPETWKKGKTQGGYKKENGTHIGMV